MCPMTHLANAPVSALAIDPSERPSMPDIEGAAPDAREKGSALRHIHNHYRHEIARVAQVLARIKAGDSPPEELAHIVLASDMRRNLEAAGTICGHQCQVLMMHHNIEEGHMFPGLDAAGNTALSKIVARLKEEHLIVHELLRRLERTAHALASFPDQEAFDRVDEIFTQLSSVVASHFGYEESELEEAIGHYLDGI